MREKRFRIFDKKTQSYDLMRDLPAYKINFADCIDIERYVIEDWTGFTDTNRKRIFEGDICKALVNGPGSEMPFDFIGECQFFESGYFIVNEKLELAFHVFIELDEWEIIGNIHENPELLNQ